MDVTRVRREHARHTAWVMGTYLTLRSELWRPMEAEGFWRWLTNTTTKGRELLSFDGKNESPKARKRRRLLLSDHLALILTLAI
jgi:hypothetical protein